MSNIDKITANEQLFAELTPEEGAVVEGGATLRLHGVFAITAREDVDWALGNGDDLYIKVNGNEIAGTYKDVDAGEFVSVNKSVSFSGTAKIQLKDRDRFSRNDNIGTLTVGSAATNGVRLARVGASLLDPNDSTYIVAYSVY